MTGTVGVLALQGAFHAHAAMLARLGHQTRLVRGPADLDGLAGIVLPGGESTTMSHLLRTAELVGPLRARLTAGLPVLGTCAGLILLGRTVLDGRPGQEAFGQLDIVVRRNGYGRQLASFEVELEVAGLAAAGPVHGPGTAAREPSDPVPSMHAIFIRAPRIVAAGPDVQVLARHEGDPVLVRQGVAMAAAFHPELGGDPRLHAHFLEVVESTMTPAAG